MNWKKSLLVLPFLILALLSSAQNYKSSKIQLKSVWNKPGIDSLVNFGNLRYSGCYGWYDTLSNRSYGFIGGTDGVYVIEVTNPDMPVQRAFIPGAMDSCIWRELKTYKHYLYMVSDDGGKNHPQIADLSFLPDSVHLVLNSDSLFVRSHTIFVEKGKLYCGGITFKDTSTAMAVFSLANPAKPVLIRKLEQDYPQIDYVHDMHVRNDTIYASCGYQGMYMFKFEGDSQFVMIGQYTVYPQQGYNHSSYLSPDSRYLVFADEVPDRLGIKLIDVSDFSNITLKSIFNCNAQATPHNPYIRNQFLYVASYKYGLRIYDISNPSSPVEKGYFDTFWQDDINGLEEVYAGNWGAYVFLPNNIILASDMQNGLFVLDVSGSVANDLPVDESSAFLLFPNPSSGNINIQSKNEGEMEIEIFGLDGRRILKQHSENNEAILSSENIPANGIFLYRIQQGEKNSSGKLIRSK